MLGGARNGYCSTASLLTVMVPSITVRIEITMATMGRRIKKFDIAFPYLFLRCRDGLFSGSHQHSRPQPLQSLGNDPLTWFDTLFNNDQILLPVSQQHRTPSLLAFIVDHENDLATLLLHNGHLRDQGRILRGANGAPHFAELPRPNYPLWIGELGDHGQSPGFLINGTVGNRHASLVRMRRSIRKDQFDRNRVLGGLAHPSGDCQILGFAQSEGDT